MSELKARTAQSIAQEEVMLELVAPDGIEPELVYLKSEADKVIAELKHDVENWMGSYEASRRVNARSESKLRHQKYKRCLAMASKCRLRARWFGDNAFYKKEKWALKWHRLWLKIAKQFKEAK